MTEQEINSFVDKWVKLVYNATYTSWLEDDGVCPVPRLSDDEIKALTQVASFELRQLVNQK